MSLPRRPTSSPRKSLRTGLFRLVDGGEMQAPTSSALLRSESVCTRRANPNQDHPGSPSSRVSQRCQTARLHQRPSVRPTVTATPKHAETASEVIARVRGPEATRCPARMRAPWVNPGGISSQWCVTRTTTGPPGSAARCRPDVPAAAPAPPGRARRMARRASRSSGSPINARASRTCWRSPSEMTPKGRSAMSATPPRARRRSALSQSSDRVPVPPRLEGAVTAAGDGVPRREVGPQLTRHGAAHQRDARAQRADVDAAQT